MIIDLNDYQTVLYSQLKATKLDEAELAVYDKVPANAKFPFAIIGNYELSEGSTKHCGATITQNIELWSDYSGKKEINTMVREVLSNIDNLYGAVVGKEYWKADGETSEVEIISIRLNPSMIQEIEGFFHANLIVQFELQ